MSSTGGPQPNGDLDNASRIKIRHHRQIYVDRTDSVTPSSSCPVTVSILGRVYDDFTRLLFFHTHHEDSILTGELPEESEQFRCLRAGRLDNLKGSVTV